MEAAVYRANITAGCLYSALHTYAASLYHAHAIVQVLDDLEGSVDAVGFGDGFHGGIVSLMIHAENPQSSQYYKSYHKENICNANKIKEEEGFWISESFP